jgi:hypothetical protein
VVIISILMPIENGGVNLIPVMVNHLI